MNLLLLVASSFAATSADIAQGWYLAESGRMEQAARLAVSSLNGNPNDLAAHRLYTWSLMEGLQDRQALEEQYRAWRAAQPDSDTARTALAGLLLDGHSEEGTWCDELEGLLEPLPNDSGTRYWALRYRYAARQICPADPTEDRQALVELAKVTPTALGFALRLRLQQGRVDQALADDLDTFYDLEPWNMAFPGNLWGDDVKGPALKQARAAAIEAAFEALKADSPAYAQSAFRVFKNAANDPGRVAAEVRRAELDPEWRTWDRDWNGERLSLTEGGRSRLERDLERARFKALPEAAMQRLDELEARIPPHGPLRAIWLTQRAYVHYNAGRKEESFATFKQAWQEDSTNASAANGFAYLAALRGEELELALVVMDSVLNESPPYDPWTSDSGTSYEAWAEDTADHMAARMDTRAWILHQLGRTEEAASVMQRALFLAREEDPILYHHLGLILLEMGKEDAALEALGRGLAMGHSEEPELDTKARAVATELFAKYRWAAGGLDAWVATRGHAPARAATRAGETLPDLDLLVDGKPRNLSEFPGKRVVVFWSSASQPFVKSLEYWKELGKRYRKHDITLLGLCVDEKPEYMDEFWDGYRLPPLLLAWAGPEGAAAAGVAETPAVFVLDELGVVHGNLTGLIREGDHQVEGWLDALFETQE